MHGIDFESLIGFIGAAGIIVTLYMGWLSGKLNDKKDRVKLEIQVDHLIEQVKELTERIEYLERK